MHPLNPNPTDQAGRLVYGAAAVGQPPQQWSFGAGQAPLPESSYMTQGHTVGVQWVQMATPPMPQMQPQMQPQMVSGYPMPGMPAYDPNGYGAYNGYSPYGASPVPVPANYSSEQSWPGAGGMPTINGPSDQSSTVDLDAGDSMFASLLGELTASHAWMHATPLMFSQLVKFVEYTFGTNSQSMRAVEQVRQALAQRNANGAGGMPRHRGQPGQPGRPASFPPNAFHRPPSVSGASRPPWMVGG